MKECRKALFRGPHSDPTAQQFPEDFCRSLLKVVFVLAICKYEQSGLRDVEGGQLGACFQYLHTQSGKAVRCGRRVFISPFRPTRNRYGIHGGVYFAVLEYPLRGKPST